MRNWRQLSTSSLDRKQKLRTYVDRLLGCDSSEVVRKEFGLTFDATWPKLAAGKAHACVVEVMASAMKLVEMGQEMCACLAFDVLVKLRRAKIE